MDTYEFLGLKYVMPVIPDLDTDTVGVRSLSYRWNSQSGGGSARVLTIRFMDDVKGGRKAEQVLSAHYERFDIITSFPIPCPQPIGSVRPGGDVRTRANAQYLKNQTSIQIVTGAGVEVETGLIFNMPGNDTVTYKVVQGRTGSGAILIRPGLRMDYTGGADDLNFRPMMQALHIKENSAIVRTPRGMSKNYTFIEDV